MSVGMDEKDLLRITCEIQNCFSSAGNSSDSNMKWEILKNYRISYLERIVSSKSGSCYYSILTNLLDSLKPTLFNNVSEEQLFDEIFLLGIQHEAFMILVRKLSETRESYQQQKVIDLLQKFLKAPQLELMLQNQCECNSEMDEKYLSMSRIWDDLIVLIVSLPERVANKTKGKMNKIFCTHFYIPLLVSAIFKTLSHIHMRLKSCQGCSLEFLSKLTGKICIIGHADIVTKKLASEFIKVSESDFVWRRIPPKFISKMPITSLESFITNLLLVVPWYGYVELIIGDEGINAKLNHIMATKIILHQYFEQEIILQNTLGYFASSKNRGSHFEKIVHNLLTLWSDHSALKYHSFGQQQYLAAALMICAGWLKKEPKFRKKAYLAYLINGTQIRIGSSVEKVRSLGMIVAENLTSVLDPDTPKLDFQHSDSDMVKWFKRLMKIPSKPDTCIFSNEEDLKLFEEMEKEKSKFEKPVLQSVEPGTSSNKIEIDSDDDLEPYDLSNDVPQEETMRPLYIRDCLAGLLEQEKYEWAEQCLKHAEGLIIANSDVIHEIAVEMAMILLHLDDKFSIPNFIGLRHRALIALAVNCPVLVADYLTSQFYARDYNIRQRLDILEVLAAASQELSHPKVKVVVLEPQYTKEKFDLKIEQHWKSIIDKRVELKTRYITKKKKPLNEPRENRFSSIAGHFFFPLMEKCDKKNEMLMLYGDDSYVLGRLTYTLGIIMYYAANIPLSVQMGSALMQFLLAIKCNDVFVRQAAIFSMAAIYIAVPSYLLCSDMLMEVLESVNWLKNIVDYDIDTSCQIKASHALGMILEIAREEMPLMPLLPEVKAIFMP